MTERTIESFLGLTDEEIKRRKQELKRNIPSTPGIEYLKTRAKQFEVQPWPFIIYLAHYNSDGLDEMLSCYVDYDGAENYQAIMEQLREHYILAQVLEDITPIKAR